ncbi:MAG: signal peptidase I [Candidatus Hodarchaeota archaeon]
MLISAITIGAIFGGAFIFFFSLKAAMNTPIPIVVVTSESMEPTIHKGDILFIKNVPAENINPGDHDQRTGDVIVYETEGIWASPIGQPVVHRVINRTYDNITGKYTFETQGDANISPDGFPVPEDNVYGKVVGQIPYIGWVKLFFDELSFGGVNIGTILLVLLGVLLVISILWDVYKPSGRGKEEENPPEAPEERD